VIDAGAEVGLAAVEHVSVAVAGRAGTIGDSAAAGRARGSAGGSRAHVTARAAVPCVGSDRGLAAVVGSGRKRVPAIAARIANGVASSRFAAHGGRAGLLTRAAASAAVQRAGPRIGFAAVAVDAVAVQEAAGARLNPAGPAYAGPGSVREIAGVSAESAVVRIGMPQWKGSFATNDSQPFFGSESQFS
jgi:hypothetical protein